MSMLNGLFVHFASAVQQQHTAVVEDDCVVVLPSLERRATVNVPRWLSYNCNGALPPYPALIIIKNKEPNSTFITYGPCHQK